MGKRKVIGVLISGIADDFSMQTCKGVMKAARGKEVDIVIIPGKYVYRTVDGIKDLAYEYQYNTLFAYVKEQRLDALIATSGSIGCYANDEQMQVFLKGFEGLPCVLIGDKREGFVSVNYDNYQGIKEGLEYLIHNLNCRKIVMVGGPNANIDAVERRQTFIEVMKENDIQISEANFIEGNLTRKQEHIYEKFLEQNPDVEAFCCVNDDTALGIYEVLKARGLEVGKDVFVMGYDNTIPGAKAKPTLSTVMADAIHLGAKALEMILGILEGERIEDVIIPTRFIRRESFGSLQNRRRTAQLKRLDVSGINDYFDEIFYRYAMELNDNRLRMVFHTIMEMTIDYYENGLSDNEFGDAITKLIEAFLRMGALEYADVENLLTHLEEVCDLLTDRFCSSSKDNRLVTKIYEIYRSVILSEEQRQGAMFDREDVKNYNLKMFVSQSMQFENGNDQNYEMLLQNLGWLDIHNALLYVYNRPIVHLHQEFFQVPRHLYLKAMRVNDEVQTIVGKFQRKRSKDIFRNGLFSLGNSVKVLLPLFSNEVLYGVLLCDMSEKLFENGEFLAGQLGAAVKILHLLKMSEDIQNQYEQSMVVLRENNIALDALAKSDGLTGIFNRRGFLEVATKKLESNKKKSKRTLVAYIDMNNLKIINDRYGHDEGDFSIQLISRILKENFPEGIVGRIGGDEFALLTEYEGTDSPEYVKIKLYDAFQSFNKESDKAYNVTVSAGMYVIEEESEIELEDALGFADEKLYIEKQHRVKAVAKECIDEMDKMELGGM